MGVILIVIVGLSLGVAALGEFLSQRLGSVLPVYGALALITLAGVWYELALTYEIGGSVRMAVGAHDYTPRKREYQAIERAWLWGGLQRALPFAGLVIGVGWVLGWACSWILEETPLAALALVVIGGTYTAAAGLCLPIQVLYFARLLKLSAELKMEP
ncbi:MAG: hypothetical protein L0332_09295 [Chloroflexi bacterium]|nr:hypothetical protein [Chloroflexota bacterium]MCI0574852.1 hypothetical protein [Chloroflexota bacterium]MCI0645930.1 hypothetical protein [Chloroflexota bacterium]MCI0726901.1 hypothetical protein [Chloroflexota bacterium]